MIPCEPEQALVLLQRVTEAQRIAIMQVREEKDQDGGNGKAAEGKDVEKKRKQKHKRDEASED